LTKNFARAADFDPNFRLRRQILPKFSAAPLLRGKNNDFLPFKNGKKSIMPCFFRLAPGMTEDTPGVTPLDDYDRFLNQHVATVDMPIRFPTKIAVPFDKFGNRLTESDGKTWTNIGEDLERFNGEAQSASSKIQNKQNWTIWDLSKNSKVKLHKDNNCVGSQQPSYVNLPGKTGSVHGFDQYSRAIVIKFDIMGKIRHVSLGEWWIEAAMKGKVGCLPFVNVRPEMA